MKVMSNKNRIDITLSHSTYAYAGDIIVKATGHTLANSVLSYIEGIVEENNRIALLVDEISA